MSVSFARMQDLIDSRLPSQVLFHVTNPSVSAPTSVQVRPAPCQGQQDSSRSDPRIEIADLRGEPVEPVRQVHDSLPPHIVAFFAQARQAGVAFPIEMGRELSALGVSLPQDGASQTAEACQTGVSGQVEHSNQDRPQVPQVVSLGTGCSGFGPGCSD